MRLLILTVCFLLMGGLAHAQIIMPPAQSFGRQAAGASMSPPSEILFTEYVRLQITPHEGARAMRKDIYEDMKKECALLETMMARQCRISRLEITPVDSPEGAPEIAAVHVTLELYDEPKPSAESKE